MIGLCSDETYDAMTNYDDRDYNGNEDRNKDGNDDKNSTSRSVSDVTIFDLITTHLSHGGGSANDGYG